MKDLDRLRLALKELENIEKEKSAQLEGEKTTRKEAEERRKRLYKFYYEQVPPISFNIPKDSSLLELEDDK